MLRWRRTRHCKAGFWPWCQPGAHCTPGPWGSWPGVPLEGGPRPSQSSWGTWLPAELRADCYRLSIFPQNSRRSLGLVHSLSSSCCAFTLYEHTQCGLCPRGSRPPVKGAAVAQQVDAITVVCISQHRRSEKSHSLHAMPHLQPSVLPHLRLLCALPARLAGLPNSSVGASIMKTDIPTSPKPGPCTQHTNEALV